METHRISKIASLAVCVSTLLPAGQPAAQDERKSLVFTKSDPSADQASWEKSSISTGPSKPAAARASKPATLAAVNASPKSLHESAEPAAILQPEGVVPAEKIETDYETLKRELSGFRLPEDEAPALPKPAARKPTAPAAPAPSPEISPETPSSSSNSSSATSTANSTPPPAKPAARKTGDGRTLRIPVTSPATAGNIPEPSSPEPAATIGSTAATEGTAETPAPGNQSRPSSGRGILHWFKRDRSPPPSPRAATADPAVVEPVSVPQRNTPGELIAEYPPPDSTLSDGAQGPAGAHSASVGPARPPETQRQGLFSRLFRKRSPASASTVAVGETPSGSPSVAQGSGTSALNQFPKLEEIKTRASKAELEIDNVVRQIHGEYENRINQITASDLSLSNGDGKLAIPRDLESAWFHGIRSNLWKSEERLAVPLRETYARALMNSNQVTVLSYLPLIGETGIQEAEGQFDPEFFATGRRDKIDRPTNTELDTGTIGRFVEDGTHGEIGVRKRFAATGGQVALSNRFSSLKNNSDFTLPNPQSTSDLVFAVRQPLLRGAGYHYNKAALKIAKLEADSAAGEYIRLLETHLLEVNRAYWGVYLARAAFLLRKSLVEQTAAIVDRIESRADEATASELLRARSELSTRRTAMNRAEMAVRNAEERLRSMVNDPEFPIGGSGEFVPTTRPILSPPKQNVKGAAREAVDNRAEIAQSFNQLRSTAVLREAGRSELRPQLDLLGEVRYGGIDEGRRLGGAYEDMFRHGTGWMAGIEFSQPWERNFAKARQQRRAYEFLQQAATVRQTIDNVLLESVVTYRELMTAYRDMQGRYQEVVSTREEVKALNERLEVDVDNKQTIAFQLQLIMDAIERNQIAEEQFLVSIVSYNIAFAALDRAKGTFLTYHDVSVQRLPDTEHGGKNLQSIKASSSHAPASPEASRSK